MEFSTENTIANVFLSKTSTNVLFINSNSNGTEAVSLVVDTIQTLVTDLNIAENSELLV
jgi:hypothetical protein